MKEFKIVKRTYHNELGESCSFGYRVYQKLSFLGFKYWSSIKETRCGWGDCYKVPIEFNSSEKAESFIKNVLCPGVKREGDIYEDISNFKCNG